MQRAKAGWVAGLLLVIIFLVINVHLGLAARDRPEFDCGQPPCAFSVDGGAVDLRFHGSSLHCSSLRGRGRFMSGTTGLTRLGFTGCRETMTPFNFSCQDPRQPQRKVEADSLNAHLLPSSSGRPELVLLDVWAVFDCGQGLKLQIEGFFTVGIDAERCGESSFDHRFPIELISHGRRNNKPAWDVYVGHRSNTYRLSKGLLFSFERITTLIC